MKSFIQHIEEDMTRGLVRTVRDTLNNDTFENDEASDVLHDLLGGSGWYVMGTGANAVVIGHPTYWYVVKLFSAEDTGYIAWVNFCIKNQHNPYVPKIKGRIVQINREVMAIRVEKVMFDHQLARIFMQGLTELRKTGTLNNRFSSNSLSGEKELKKIRGFIDNNPYLINDLHQDNVGFRYDPTSPVDFFPVIVDPVLPRHSRGAALNPAFLRWMDHRFRSPSRQGM